MAARIQNMTQGRPGKLIFTFALPLMVGNVFQQLYTVVDTMVVGKYLGVGALAALGAADWMNWMMLGIVQGFTQGCAILMAREFGAGNYPRLRDVIGGAGVLCALFSLLLTGRDSWRRGRCWSFCRPPGTFWGTRCCTCASCTWASR